MVQLGMKINKAFNMLGNKASKAANMIGNKTNDVLKQAKSISNRIPEMNEKAINIGNNVIQKSGSLTDALRKGSAIGNQVVQAGIQLGGKDIPIIGTALQLAGKGTSALASGAKKLDKIRDNAQQKLNNYSDVSRNALNNISEIEKMNGRKRLEMMQNADSGMSNFA